MVSFDIKAGYRHFRLAPKMRNWFLFRYEDKYYRCVRFMKKARESSFSVVHWNDLARADVVTVCER
jgi:hypothetical protein